MVGSESQGTFSLEGAVSAAASSGRSGGGGGGVSGLRNVRGEEILLAVAVRTRGVLGLGGGEGLVCQVGGGIHPGLDYGGRLG